MELNYKEKKVNYHKERYRTDPEYRAKCIKMALEYYRKNKERIKKEYNERRRLKYHSDEEYKRKTIEQVLRYQRENEDIVKEKRKQYYEKNKEICKKRTLDWIKRNRERWNAYQVEYKRKKEKEKRL